MNKRKIAVVTGSRAEYGLLYWLLHEIKQDPDLELQLIATGMHLSHEFGNTYKLIEEDGFKIQAKVESQLSSDSAVGVTKSIGLGIIGFAETFATLMPDLVIMVGDRFEILSAAQAALIAKIPIAHLHGGEVTVGAFDESIRHAITKMAALHFVAAENYRQRVIQLGEQPTRVFNVGAIGLEHVTRSSLLEKSVLETQLGVKFNKLTFLVTYHSATVATQSTEKSIVNLLAALDEFPEAKIIFTKSNADPAGRLINDFIDLYVKKHRRRAIAFTNLGSVFYLSTLKFIDVVIGNSSSGIIEAPLFNKPTVNIGQRQKGRLRSSSILDCEEDIQSIAQAIRQAINLLPKLQLSPVASLYGVGNTASAIKEIIKQVDLTSLVCKEFYDLPAPSS